MARTTLAEVKAIMKADLDTVTDANIEAIIPAASRLVTALLGSVSGVSSDQLEDIEMYLTAHMATATIERQIKNAGGSGAPEVNYTGSFYTGLGSTSYGQTVMLLDTTGKLKAADGKRAVSVTAITSFE